MSDSRDRAFCFGFGTSERFIERAHGVVRIFNQLIGTYLVSRSWRFSRFCSESISWCECRGRR